MMIPSIVILLANSIQIKRPIEIISLIGVLIIILYVTIPLLELLIFPSRAMYRQYKKKATGRPYELSCYSTTEERVSHLIKQISYDNDLFAFSKRLASSLVEERITIFEKCDLLSALDRNINFLSEDIRVTLYNETIAYSYCNLSLHANKDERKKIKDTVIGFISIIRNSSKYPLSITSNLFAFYFADIIVNASTINTKIDSEDDCLALITNPCNYGLPTLN